MPDKVGKRCEFCGSSSLVPYEQVKDAFRPESLLPLKISESQGARSDSRVVRPPVVRAEQRSGCARSPTRSRPSTFPTGRSTRPCTRNWTAEAGDYYYGCSRASNRVRHVRWYPAAGALDHAFDDELVCASMGVRSALLRRIEPFPTAELVPYDAGFVAGWTVERYQIDLVAAAEESRRRMDAQLRSLCASQVPGDTHRNLVVDATYSRPDVQAHPRADLAAHLHLRRRPATRSSSTASPARWPARGRGAGSRSRLLVLPCSRSCSSLWRYKNRWQVRSGKAEVGSNFEVRG